MNAYTDGQSVSSWRSSHNHTFTSKHTHRADVSCILNQSDAQFIHTANREMLMNLIHWTYWTSQRAVCQDLCVGRQLISLSLAVLEARVGK